MPGDYFPRNGTRALRTALIVAGVGAGTLAVMLVLGLSRYPYDGDPSNR